MGILRTEFFGGLIPNDSPRALPNTAGQIARDLLASTREFRPLKTDVQVVANSGVTNPLTIYRLQRKADGSFNTDFADATTWKTNALSINYVRGQLNDDITERTYLTYNDGSAPPRVIDATGQDRQLGVPAPVDAPAVVVNVVDEFTTDDRTSSLDQIASDLKNTASSMVVPVWRGAASTDPTSYRPGTSHQGYADRADVPGVNPQPAQQLRMFRTSSTAGADNGTITNDYAGHSGQVWPFDSSLGGFWKAASGGWPSGLTWPGTTYDHWCIPFSAYGLTYDIDGTGLSSALSAIDMPGGTTGQKLLTSDQVTEVMAKVADMSNQQWTDVAPKLTALYAKVQQFKAILDGGSAGALVAANQAFYARSDITALFTDAVANAAEAIWNQALQAANFVEWNPPGGP